MQTIANRVVALVADQCKANPEKLSSQTTLLGDLGIDGDDGVELLERFGREFSVDLSGCDPRHYFGPEGFAPRAPVLWLVLAFRQGTPEQRARLQSIRIADLIRSAELGRWDVGPHKEAIAP